MIFLKDVKILSQFTKLNQKLNPSFNEYVTRVCHDYHIPLTPVMRKFLRKCYDINVICGLSFTYLDFRIKPNTFQKRMERLKPFFEPVIRSSIGFYKLRGIEMYNGVTKNPRWVTPNPVHPDFESILKKAQKQPLSMHDLRVETKVFGLYENLIEIGQKPHPQNKSFTLNLYAGERFAIKANIYRTGTMQIMVGCSGQPLVYDLWGFLELSGLLQQSCNQLQIISENIFHHQPIPNWRVTYLHINQDIEISGKRFSYCVHDLANHSVIYNKKFGNGIVKERTEKHETPNKTIEEMINQF